MGISMAGSDAFTYNRFDALNEAYLSLYEKKEEEDDDDEKEEKDEKGLNPFKKRAHEKDETEEEEREEEEDEDDEEEGDDDDKDEEKSDKKFPSFLKKSKGDKVEEACTDKGNRLIDAYDRPPYSDDEDKRDPKKLKMKNKLPKGTVKEEVIEYLMDEGFVNNEVSAEVFIEHMSDEWLENIMETKFDERGRPKSGPANVYGKGRTDQSTSFMAAYDRVREADKKKSPEQRKKELDAYKERQANR